MSFHGIAKGKSFEKTIEMLKNAEINGANQYFTMYFLAKELGYFEIADAIYKNAAEDAAHGGIYSHLLGEGPDTKEAFVKMVINFYKAEASADTILAKLADEVRNSNEEGAHKIAELIEHSIPEELDHAKRLEEAMKACNIEF